MDATQALADLQEISAQIEAAVIAERSGAVVASTIRDEERAGRFARAAAALLKASEEATPQGSPIQLEAALGDASVFVVREGDRLIAAVTSPDPTIGLVFYDLKSALRSTAEVEAEPEAKPPVRESGPVEGVSGEPGGSPAPEAKPPVRESGPVEGVSGEPGGSPAPTEAAAEKPAPPKPPKRPRAPRKKKTEGEEGAGDVGS